MENKGLMSNSPWTSFLEVGNEDPFYLFKDNVSYQLEMLIIKIQDDLMANAEYTVESARKMAICVLMERMLIIQHEHSPKALEAMTVSLFTDLPGLKDFRYELLEKASEIYSPKKWYQRILSK